MPDFGRVFSWCSPLVDELRFELTSEAISSFWADWHRSLINDRGVGNYYMGFILSIDVLAQRENLGYTAIIYGTEETQTIAILQPICAG